MGFGFSGDTSSTSSRCISVEEQKQSIKQEPLPNKTKTRDVPADNKPRDARRDQHRSWERSSISRQEPLTESKPGLVTKKVMKDEKLPSPIASDCSLDLCNNNINHNKKQHHVNGSNESVRPNLHLQLTGSVRSTATTENSMNSVDFKPHVKILQSPDQCNETDDGRNSRLSQVSSCGKGGLNGSLKVVNRVQITPEPNCSSSSCSDLHETKQNIGAFSLSAGSTQNRSNTVSSNSASISQADEELVQDSSTGCLSVTDLTGDLKIDIDLASPRVSADMPAAGSSDNTSADITTSSQPMTGDLLRDSESTNAGSSANPSDKPTEGTSCLIQNGVYYEEISNDGMETDGKTDAEGECEQVEEKLSAGLRHDVTASNNAPFSKTCDSSSDSSQHVSFNTKTESNHLVSPLPVPFSLPSSAPSALSFVPLSSSLSSVSCASVSISSPSMSSSSSDVSAFFATTLKVPSIVKNDAQNVPLLPTALTLYVDGSVKPPKTSVSGRCCRSWYASLNDVTVAKNKKFISMQTMLRL